jgi:chaperonin GroEL (HSP60 family)
MSSGPGNLQQNKPGRGKPPSFDMLRHNLGMATALEEFLASTYGPGGRMKLIQDSEGKPVLTASGRKMLEELTSSHPVTKVLRAAAKAQDEEWGDGTKLATLTALCLLRRASDLLDMGVRPPHIIHGYETGLEIATKKAMQLARSMSAVDEDILLQVARSSLGQWVEGEVKETLARAVVQAALHVAGPDDGGWECDRRDIHVFDLPGSSFSVELVEGYVLKRFPDYHEMPRRVENARIALFDAAPIRGKAGIHAPRLRWIGESKIKLQSPREIEEYEEWGEEYTRDLVRGLQRAGANVVLCRLGISDYGHKLLADAGIMGIRRIMKTKHMEAVARATGGSFIKDFRHVRPEDLGYAALVEERRYSGEKYLVISGAKNPQVVSLLILAPGEALAGQLKERARKAIGAVASVIEDPRIVAGGSGIEMAAAQHVRREAPAVGGREHLAVEAFSRAMEDLVAIMAVNLGLNPLDTLIELRHQHSMNPNCGLQAGCDRPVDLTDGPVFDSLAPRLAAWDRGVDVCRTILRVDDFHKTRGKLGETEKGENGKEGEESGKRGEGQATGV